MWSYQIPKFNKGAEAALIQDYKSRNLPYLPDIGYRHKLEGLMSEFYELRNLPLSLEIDEKTFRFYCYIYLNPLKPGKFKYVTPSGKVLKFNYEPFYVGKGTRNRMQKHLLMAKNTNNKSHKANIIRKITSRKLKPIVVMSSRVSDCMAHAFEVDLITGIGRSDLNLGPLANHTDGGEGKAGNIPSKQARLRMSKARKDRVVSEETRRKLSQVLKGKKFSDAHRKALSLAHMGIRRTKESRERQSETQKGKVHSPETICKISAALQGIVFKKVECPYCEKRGGLNAMKRYHFENCRKEGTT